MIETLGGSDLFSTQARDRGIPDIAGLSYIPDFLNAEEEAALIRMIDTRPWITELKRRVQHYGYRYDYKARGPAKDLYLGSFPEWLELICGRLSKTHFDQAPDQVIVNEYRQGQGIAPHTDCIPCFGDVTASISLHSGCQMDFICGDIKKSIYLEPCSLLILSGDARYQWKHGIAGRKFDRLLGEILPRSRRLSLTFRNVNL